MKIERIIFFQSAEALDEAFGCDASDLSDDELVDKMMDWHYPGEHETSHRISAGSSDHVFWRTVEGGHYILTRNLSLGYAGLEFEPSLVEALPENVEEIKKYRRYGFTVRLFDTHKTNHQGRSVLVIQVKCGRKVIYQQNGFCPSPLHADDSLETIASAIAFAAYDLDDDKLSLLSSDIEERKQA